MNELQIFNYGDIPVRTVLIDNEPWWVLSDVCRVLNITNHKNVAARLDPDEKGVHLMDTPGGIQKVTIINEPGTYKVILRSDKPQAKDLMRWVTHDVLPAIRKTGGYIAATTEMTDSEIMARALLVANDTIKRRDEQIRALQAENEAQKQAIADFEPKMQYLDTILSSQRTLTVTQIAADYDMSPKKLNKILHEAGVQRYVNGQWILYSKYMGKGYTKSKTINITRSDGRPDTVLNTEWTQKGRLMIHEILTARGIQAVMDKNAA